jgi:hypothetical protein
MPKIALETVQRIIREEIRTLREGPDYDAASKLMGSAAKMLGALESFKETASEKVKSELGECMETLEGLLKRVAESPLKYVDSAKPNPAVADGMSTGDSEKVSIKPVLKKSQG